MEKIRKFGIGVTYPKAKIGRECNIGQNVFVGENVVIGNGVKIQNNVSIYSGVKIEDNVFVGPSVVFTNVKFPRSKINQKKNFLKTQICKGSTLGANSTIICGIKVGKNSFVGAGSVVTKDVKDNSLVYGNPAKYKKNHKQMREIKFNDITDPFLDYNKVKKNISKLS